MSSRIKDFVNRGTVPLVGRDAELRALVDAFGELLDGEARSVWITGAAGVGKSRLIDELRNHIRVHPARSIVVHAKWYEGEGIAFGPLGNALDVLRPALAAPVASRIFRDASVATTDAAVEALQIVSRRYPVVLILDDLHYVGASDDIERFIDSIEDIPLLLLATTRPSDNVMLRRLRTALNGSIPPRDLDIGPLSAESIAEAARTLFGTSPPPPLLEQIAELSAGLPLALREVFRELIAAEVVRTSEGDDTATWETTSIPAETMRTIGERVHGFAGRLEALPESERGILVLAASLGEQFNRELLRHVAERIAGWDDLCFEHLILGGFVSVATPSVRIGTREPEGRVCYAFTHSLLWQATAACETGRPPREQIADIVVRLLVEGIGELHSVAPLEHLDIASISDDELRELFGWLEGVGRRLSPIFADTYLSLCRSTLGRVRTSGRAIPEDADLRQAYLAALSAYGERLYLTGARDELEDVAAEIASLLERDVDAPATPEQRVARLEAAVVVWHEAELHDSVEGARAHVERVIGHLPPPSEQTDRELRGSAVAIRLLASYAFARGDFAEGLELALPYVSEVDRMGAVTMNALLKVLQPAMLTAGRERELGEILETALALRHQADAFTSYELLMQAINFAKYANDFAAMRRYAVEARELIDRYPSYRNQGTKYWYLPWVAAHDGNVEELDTLEHDFRSSPPPARSPAIQLAVARHQFQIAWNLLGDHARARTVAEELEPDVDTMPPFLRLRYLEELLRSVVDAADTEALDSAICRLETSWQADDTDPDVDTPTERHRRTLLVIARALEQDEPDELLAATAAGLAEAEIDSIDGFRAARLLLEAAARSQGRTREFNDAAYTTIERSLKSHESRSAPGLAHHRLDALGPLLPKTRLTKFRQAIGDDPRRRSAGESDDSERPDTLEPGAPILRTFGALRIEGAGDGGSKLESKTRTLVAALVVARLGATRWIPELTRDQLAYLLWPDMDIDRAVNNLHATLSYARRYLGGSETIRQIDGVYELSDDVRIDAVDAREDILKGDRLYTEGVYFGAAVAYRQAIDLANGDLLEGMYAEWIDSIRESMRGQLATALERLITIELERDNYTAIPHLAERLLALDDLHDGAYEALIRSAATRGARREAFTYFKRYQTALDEYGAGPARRITELMERVRSGEIEE